MTREVFERGAPGEEWGDEADVRRLIHGNGADTLQGSRGVA
jgi:hypothetical protein